MNDDNIKQEFVTAIRSRGIFSKWDSSKGELITKCPFCGDNNRPDDGHFYISINFGKDIPMLYHCFRCNAGGAVNADVSSELINDDDIINNIKLMNGGKKYNVKVSKRGKVYKWIIPKATTNFKYKIDYINSRLGLVVDKEFYDRSKMILNFEAFYKINKIEPNMNVSFFNTIQKQFVGFLSANGTHIWLRNIMEKCEIRWTKQPIVKCDDSKNFYSISNSVDVLSEDIININLSEGVFDCLSIWKNLNRDTQTDINIAVGSSDYTSTINHLMSLGFIGSNVILNIYSDNDNNSTTKSSYHRRTLDKYRQLFGGINLYYNIMSKDCGVPKKEIRLKKEVLD